MTDESGSHLLSMPPQGAGNREQENTYHLFYFLLLSPNTSEGMSYKEERFLQLTVLEAERLYPGADGDSTQALR